MEHVAKTLINGHIVEIIEKRANLCQVLVQNNFKYRQYVCQKGEACGFSSLQVQDHDSILDIQAARKKFFSKFVLTEDVLRRGRVDTQRIIVVYYSKLEQQKFTIFFRKHYPLLQDRHYLIPKKSTAYKDEFVTSEILENCDTVVFCVFTIPDEDHASKYREALQMLKSKKKRVLFGCRKSKSLSRVTLYHPDIEIIRLRKDPVSTALLLDYALLGTNGI
ncbi:hypothetical protein C9374_013910 [Naegleria lovaniensis]|uniref:Uncharacterized protein n=1 Tax=Naegleria lovaniensis TaxID=51637 RepID=A0AA88KMV2_NAELO|nr:uncharacterized protein C9374_013910 [Naegleria lovaniensis]KAG2389350.1 hypothetical protein C9374_013910 [Naegleria lovaniensis]